MVAFILCSGKSLRWNNYLGIPKQHIKISEETLIDRTIRLLKKFTSCQHIYIVSNNAELKNDSCHYFTPTNSNTTVQTLYSTKDLWQHQNIILLGDVFYSEGAIKLISQETDNVRFYGKPLRCKFFDRERHGEILGLRFRLAKRC